MCDLQLESQSATGKTDALSAKKQALKLSDPQRDGGQGRD